MKMRDKILKHAYILLMIVILTFSNLTLSIAATKDELNEQENELNNKIEKTENEIKTVKGEISATMSDIQNLDYQISTYENEIAELETEIEQLNSEIEYNAVCLKEQEEKYAKQQDLLAKRLVALYEAGSTSYLDVLLSSRSLPEFLSNYYLIETLAECDTNLLNSIEKLKNEIAATKAQLEDDKEVVENNKETVEAKKAAVLVIKNEKTTKVAQLNSEERALQDALDEFEEDKRRIQSELASILAAEAAAAAKNNANVSSNPSSAGYISPLAGKTKNNITTGYYAYPYHTGVDFAVGSGTPVLAVKAGTVQTSTALRNPNGTYRSYGEYIIINHHDGTATLYAHGTAGSRKVSPGETVAQGQVIMLVGSTGNSSGPHLHFEVRTSAGAVNPVPYLP